MTVTVLSFTVTVLSFTVTVLSFAVTALSLPVTGTSFVAAAVSAWPDARERLVVQSNAANARIANPAGPV
jgi:uncharacterized membrane protein YccF (DUF307 family)